MDQIRNLLWLRTRLTLGLYRKRTSLLVSLFILVPVMAALALALYFGGLVVIWGLPPDNSRQLIHLGLTTLYAMWLTLPLLGVSLNESQDISKLLHFPVPPKTIFLANIIGAFTDPFVVGVLIVLACIPVALGATAGAKILLIGLMLLFVFHVISFSQALLTLLWGLLRSRRVRDFWKIVVSLGGMAFWISYQVVMRRFTSSAVGFLMVAQPSRFTRFLPSGITADAAMAVQRGDIAGFAWRAGILLAICAATVVFAGWLIQRIVAGDLVLDSVGQAVDMKERAKRARQPGGAFEGPAWLSPAVAAMARKEWLTILRDPTVKVEMLRSIMSVIILPIILLVQPHNDFSVNDIHRAGPYAIGWVLFSMLVATIRPSSNVLARDRGGLSLLFTLPAPREAFLYGKNIAALIILTPLNVAISLVACAAVKQWGLLVPSIIAGQCIVFLGLGSGNLFSVWAPYPMPQRGQNALAAGSGRGCLGAVIALLSFPFFLVVAAPIVAGLFLPIYFHVKIWMLATVPLSAIYSGLLYWGLTAMSANRMVKREPEILATILKTPA